MKKLLSKIEHVPATGHSQNSCIGKSWSLPKHNVTVEEIIAEGGFGIVFLAKHGSQKFALKRMIVNNEHDLAVATREIQIMTSLGDHPNILSCLDYLVTPLGGGVTEILGLMPLCKGSLLSLLNTKMSAKTHLTEVEALQIFSDIITGVARLHQCATPIIHRDLKIENVLEDEGKFVLCDFGSATPKFWDPAVHGVAGTQEDLEKYTTLAYRSPEMIDLYSNRGPITTKADIWALGVLLYKMCFYTTPFGDSILAIQSAHFTFPSTSPFSVQLHAYIQYMLTTDSTLRPDVYQVAELCFGLLGLPNPIPNVSGAPAPPNIETLVQAMTAAAVVAKLKNEEKPAKTAVVAPVPVTATETSVTPRQRPKGNIVVPTATVGAGLLPPPKSPKPIELNNHQNHGVASPSTLQIQTPPTPSSSTTTAAANGATAATDIGHRRNASDSSAFDKGSLPPTELQNASSETLISSWNPFAADCFQANGSQAASSSASAPAELSTDDDPFAKAPFDHFKYRPELVDLFGSAPFSNPFLEFSAPPGNQGVTNLSFEDER